MPNLKPRGHEVVCPMCSAPVWAAKHYFIDWNEDARQFTITMSFFCDPCRFRFEEQLITQIPVTIAQTSECSCGSTLQLLDHSFNRVGDELEFSAKYSCPSCNAKRRTFVAQLKRGLRSLWRNTKTLEIGVGGVKYEKATGDQSAEGQSCDLRKS